MQDVDHMPSNSSSKINFVSTPENDLIDQIQACEAYILFNTVHDRAPFATEAAEQELNQMLKELECLRKK